MIDYFANGNACPSTFKSSFAANGNGQLQPFALSTNEASALTGVGITQLQAMVTATPSPLNGFDPTFNNYTTSNTQNFVPIAAGNKLVGLDPTNSANTAAIACCTSLNLPLTGRYVAVGLGPFTTMVGKTLSSAPVHFGDQPVLNPEYGYERLVALFKVSDSAAPAFTQAQLVGVGPIHDSGFGRIDDELQNWFQIQTGGS